MKMDTTLDQNQHEYNKVYATTITRKKLVSKYNIVIILFIYSDWRHADQLYTFFECTGTTKIDFTRFTKK